MQFDFINLYFFIAILTITIKSNLYFSYIVNFTLCIFFVLHSSFIPFFHITVIIVLAYFFQGR